MKDSNVKKLVTALANYYGSVPVSFARNTVMEWHPDITPEQFDRVILANAAGESQNTGFVLATNGSQEPELVNAPLFYGGNYASFMKLRKDMPFAVRSEEEISKYESPRIIDLEIPEVTELYAFAQKFFGLDHHEDWKAVILTMMAQEESLHTQKSWVLTFFMRSGEIESGMEIRSLKQIRLFRDLGNRMFRAVPNQYLRGWKPKEVDIPLTPPDDLPEDDAGLFHVLNEVCEFCTPGGQPLETSQMSGEDLVTMLREDPRLQSAHKVDFGRKVGRNEPCPCGSGKKYKKCCGR